MNKTAVFMTATGAFALALACGDSSNNGGGGTTPATLNFNINDTANKTHDDTDRLAWKGDFSVTENPSGNPNPTLSILALDKTWDDPNPRMWDDGPWNQGGHEPAGALAGDNDWGVALQFQVQEEESRGYGSVRNAADIGNPVAYGDGDWIWIGANGEFTVAPNVAAVGADPLVIPAFGDTDMRLTVNLPTAQGQADRFNDCTGVNVKGSAWGWTDQDMTTSGDDWGFVFSTFADTQKHSGLLSTGQEPEFVFNMLDCPTMGGGVATLEYKNDEGEAISMGVTAETSTDNGTTWTPATIQLRPPGEFGANTYIVIP